MAVQKRFYVALDIKRPTANRDFEVVEGDNGNVLEIELTDDGTAVDLAGCLVVAVFSKSDGAAQQDSDGHGISVDAEQHNKLTISLYSTSVAPGLVECELQVFSGEDHATLVTSAKFNFMCRRGIANGDVVQATEEWPLLVSALNRVEAAEVELSDLNEETTTAKNAANAAAAAANEAAENANTATSAANSAASAADEAASSATSAASSATSAASAATSAASAASSAASSATSATSAANTATGAANTATSAANSAASAASSAASSATSAAYEATSAALSASSASSSAASAASAADIAAGSANHAAEYAEEQGDYAKSMGDATADIINSGITWATLPGMPTEFTPEAHTHGADDLPDASTSAQGIVQLSNDVSSTEEGKAATPKAVKYVNDKANEMLRREAATYSSGAPNFTAAYTPAWTEYPTYFPFLISFGQDVPAGSTLNVNGLGARPILKAHDWTNDSFKAGFYWMVTDGTRFFVVSKGGGLELPGTIVAGDTCIHSKATYTQFESSSYVDVGAGWGFVAQKAGAYRIRYAVAQLQGGTSNYTYGQLVKNGVAVAGSEIFAKASGTGGKVTEIAIDITLAAGDTLKMQVKDTSPYYNQGAVFFTVSISVTDLQAALNNVITVL